MQRFFAVLLLCSWGISSASALPDFTLIVNTVDEACAGTGQIQFSSSGTAGGATIKYVIYQLPDLVTPIGVFFAPGSLNVGHGNFRVIATQTLGAESNTQTQDVTIADVRTQLLYTISGTAVTCTNNGTMTVNIFSGTGDLYEIISGPVTVPPQSSNIFTGLPAGQYEVRVYDICGEAWVATHTLQTGTGNIVMAPITGAQQALVACDSITITNSLTPATGTSLSYPITVQYTITPPDGSTPTVTTTTLNAGELTDIEFSVVIPYYGGQQYSYNALITDACGNTYTYNSIPVINEFAGQVQKKPSGCDGYYLMYTVDDYLSPLTVEFLSAPPGFDPVTYNAGHPGPFSGETITYGDQDLAVPLGTYSAKITDACGKSVILDVTLEWEEPDPTVGVTPGEGCNSDHSNIVIHILDYEFTTAFIIAGPPAYSAAYPVDVSSAILAGGFIKMYNLPTGNYTISLTDECGRTYTKDFVVPPLFTSASFSTRADCEIGKGGVRIRGNSTMLQSAMLLAAPAAYTHPLPYDVSFNITSPPESVFSMAGLPPGSYQFEVTDECAQSHAITAVVTRYAIASDSYNVTPHCGSFDLELHHACNGTTQSYWLQSKNPATGTWGHPETGFIYPDGTAPNDDNSLRIQNNAINYNISYLGDFRIVLRFESFENGSVAPFKDCIEVIREFTFNNALAITDIQKTSCNGVFSDITITANGFPPLTYQITEKNGIPFTVNNATNNVFANLETAIYNFQVFDTCGNQTNLLADIALLPSLVDIAQPGSISDIIECEHDSGDGNATFTLTERNAVILGDLNTANYSITFHATIDDAAADANPLPESFDSAGQVVYARVEYNGRADCFDITSFKLVMNDFPDLTIDQSLVICSGNPLSITADGGFNAYQWSTGEISQSITVSAPGTYTVILTKILNGMTCTRSVSIDVAPSQNAVIDHIDTVDWTENENSITIVLDDAGNGNFLYSLDNIHFQNEHVFSGLKTGEYTVYIQDINGCDSTTQIVYLLGYPKFFTPNGDGYNDYWQIYFASKEPHLQVHVFDRYGKLLKVFGPESPGWDGTYNGSPMPSTDYWFVAVRENGKEYRGHFAMKR